MQKMTTKHYIIGFTIAFVMAMAIFSADKDQTARANGTVTTTQTRSADHPMEVMMYKFKKTLKDTARDPSSIKFKNEKMYNNGVCVDVNGKNGFGGMTGFQEHCLVTNDGKTQYLIDNIIQK